MSRRSFLGQRCRRSQSVIRTSVSRRRMWFVFRFEGNGVDGVFPLRLPEIIIIAMNGFLHPQWWNRDVTKNTYT